MKVNEMSRHNTKNAHNLVPEKGEKETPEFLGSSDFTHSTM